MAGIIALILVGSTNLYVKIDSWQKVDVPLQKMHELVLSNDDCVGARAVLNSEVCGNPFEMQVPPEFAMVAGNDMYGYSFDKGSDSRLDCSLPDAITNSCTIGDLTSNNSILLAGDSHAQQLIAAFDYYGKKMNLKVIVTVTAGEGALDEKRSDFIKNEITKVDSVYVAQIFKYGIDSIQRVPTIELLEEIIGLANSIDKPVTLIQDIPWVGESCGSKHSIDNKNCKSPISEAIDNYVQENLSLDGFSDRYNYIQTSHIFCDTDFCYSTIGKLPVYHDHYAAPVNNAHITQSFSHTLGDFFAESISQIRSTKE
ncbi:hypothetical protein FACS1894125_4350 [Actinomycetota bacterium]|nr:hypothetical protein FACS1894125_4350 [Actinomycetota bacterium]